MCKEDTVLKRVEAVIQAITPEEEAAIIGISPSGRIIAKLQQQQEIRTQSLPGLYARVP